MEDPIRHKAAGVPPEQTSEAVTSPIEGEDVVGAIYPESETHSEILDRRIRTAQSGEAEKRKHWEQIIEAQQANPHAIIDYRLHRP